MQFAYTNCKRIEKSVAVKLLLLILFSDIKKKAKNKITLTFELDVYLQAKLVNLVN